VLNVPCISFTELTHVDDLSHDAQHSPSLRRSALIAAALIALFVTGAAWPGDSHRAQAAEAVIRRYMRTWSARLLSQQASNLSERNACTGAANGLIHGPFAADARSQMNALQTSRSCR
jgi:hypothetical protein